MKELDDFLTTSMILKYFSYLANLIYFRKLFHNKSNYSKTSFYKSFIIIKTFKFWIYIVTFTLIMHIYFDHT